MPHMPAAKLPVSDSVDRSAPGLTTGGGVPCAPPSTAGDEDGTLTKARLAQALMERMGLPRRDAQQFVDAFFDLIAQRLIAGEGVKISGLGHFHLRDKSQRPGRNPRTGEPVPVTARRVVTFHPSALLKQQYEQQDDG